MTLMAALSQRTKRVKIGTACIVVTTRNPLYLALEWATLDQISGGRTIFGPCMGNPEKGVRREFEAVGLPYKDRAAIFEEVLEIVLRALDREEDLLHGQVLRLRRGRVQLGHRDGAARAAAAAAAALDRLEPAARGRPGRGEGAPHHGARRRPHHQVRRRLDDLLPRASTPTS